MRADAALERTPVVFMTAKAMPQEIERFRHLLGTAGVIAKPSDPLQLGQGALILWRKLQSLRERREMDGPLDGATLVRLDQSRARLARQVCQQAKARGFE